MFALANKRDELEFELSSMASLLAKFRIDYSDLQLISDITTKPLDTTQQYFDSVIKDFVKPDQEEHGRFSNIMTCYMPLHYINETSAVLFIQFRSH